MINHQTVQVHEKPDRWVAVNLKYGTTHTYKTLADALNAIREQDERNAEQNITSVTEVVVTPTTRIGKIVADTLVDTKQTNLRAVFG